MRPTPKTDAVFAILEDGTTRQVGRPCTWSKAQARWARLDDRRALRRKHARIDQTRTRYYVVRSVDDPDPRWAGAPYVPVHSIINER